MKMGLFILFEAMLLLAMGLVLYLAFASVFVGCRPVDVNEAEL